MSSPMLRAIALRTRTLFAQQSAFGVLKRPQPSEAPPTAHTYRVETLTAPPWLVRNESGKRHAALTTQHSIHPRGARTQGAVDSVCK